MAASTPPTPAPCRTCGQSFSDEVLVCPNDGSHLPLEGRLLDGKFRLQKRLGHGGMASVWQATHEFIARPVAIKLMHTSYAADAELLARFRNEARAAGRIGSPHICDVLDFGRSEIGPYIVMELLSGCSLSDLIQAYRRLDPGLAVWIVRQTLEGLDAAHRVGIVHRDLKPENIYLCRAIRDQWVVKLMDFGISKFTDSLRTGAGTMMGSPNYMAPEQIHGAAAVDARADLWSIGAILYESLAGQQAFARDTIADSLAAVRNFDPAPIHSLAPEVPPGLSEIVARCLRKQPDQRWVSARALADALLPFEKPGPRARLLPTTPVGDVPRASTTLPKSGAVPRALADADARPPSGPVPGARQAAPQVGPPARSGGAAARAGGASPSGAHPPVPSARSPVPGPTARSAAPSGAHPPVSSAKSAPSGAHPPVPSARSTGAHPPVPSARSTGAHPPVAGPRPAEAPRPGAPPRSAPSGVHAPVGRPTGSTGAHLPVPATRSAAAPVKPAAPPRAPVPAVSPRQPAPPSPGRTPQAGDPSQNLLVLVVVLAVVGAAAATIAWLAL